VHRVRVSRAAAAAKAAPLALAGDRSPISVMAINVCPFPSTVVVIQPAPAPAVLATPAPTPVVYPPSAQDALVTQTPLERPLPIRRLIDRRRPARCRTGPRAARERDGCSLISSAGESRARRPSPRSNRVTTPGPRTMGQGRQARSELRNNSNRSRCTAGSGTATCDAARFRPRGSCGDLDAARCRCQGQSPMRVI